MKRIGTNNDSGKFGGVFAFSVCFCCGSSFHPGSKNWGQSLNPRDIYKLISCLCGCLKVMIQIRNS
jgi:hypothetical protein